MELGTAISLHFYVQSCFLPINKVTVKCNSDAFHCLGDISTQGAEQNNEKSGK